MENDTRSERHISVFRAISSAAGGLAGSCAYAIMALIFLNGEIKLSILLVLFVIGVVVTIIAERKIMKWGHKCVDSGNEADTCCGSGCDQTKGEKADMENHDNRKMSRSVIELGRTVTILRIIKNGFRKKDYHVENDLNLLRVLKGIEEDNLDFSFLNESEQVAKDTMTGTTDEYQEKGGNSDEN